MRFVGLAKPGGPEAMLIETGPTPAPGPGEILIEVHAAGVNRPDIQQRKGLYPPPAGASPVLGLEVAGKVAALGEGVQGWTTGNNICALVNGGGYAEFCLAPSGQCLPWPAGYDAVRAAALPENFFTVWANVFGMGRLAAGETLLVHGGSSGIGTVAIMLGRAFGARVLATAGSAEKCTACERLGALAINYHETDFVSVVRERTDIGVDVVLDMVAGPYIARNVSCLAKDGRLVVIAVQGGTRVENFDILPVMVKRLTITGSTLRPRSAAEKAAIAAALHNKVWPLLDAGAVAPIIHTVFPIDEVADAHRLMESGAHIGKIILRVA